MEKKTKNELVVVKNLQLVKALERSMVDYEDYIKQKKERREEIAVQEAGLKEFEEKNKKFKTRGKYIIYLPKNKLDRQTMILFKEGYHFENLMNNSQVREEIEKLLPKKVFQLFNKIARLYEKNSGTIKRKIDKKKTNELNEKYINKKLAIEKSIAELNNIEANLNDLKDKIGFAKDITYIGRNKGTK